MIRACIWFWVWVLAGALTGFAFLIGGFLWGSPVVLSITLLALVWRAPGWPHALGLVTGLGVAPVTVAVIQVFDRGLDPRPWAAIGITLVVLGAVSFRLLGGPRLERLTDLRASAS
jgi:hypothetical protein